MYTRRVCGWTWPQAQNGSEGAFRALAEAIELAKLYDAELHTISVEEVPHCAGTIGDVLEEQEVTEHRFGEVIERSKDMARQQGMRITSHIVIGHEVKSIVEFIGTHGFDLLVLGFMGHSALYDRVMGSTCQSLVRLAPCSVVVVK